MNEDLTLARSVLEAEAQSILAARERLDDGFNRCVDRIVNAVASGGKVVVTGVGKSGKIAAKIAATLASTGTPALFLHPTEGAHGDLGVVSSKDVLLALSYSGASDEILKLLPRLKALGAGIISIVGNTASRLAQESDGVLDGGVAAEACPLNLAPTSSTTVALALGDALAVALSKRFDFKEEDFANNHPGGPLGRRLTLRVRDLMKKGSELPWVEPLSPVDMAIAVSTEKQLGAVLVRDGRNLVGLITDGDLRRALKHREKFFTLKAGDVMTPGPVTIAADELALRALQLMENRTSQINVLPVTDGGACVGLVRLHDLIGKL